MLAEVEKPDGTFEFLEMGAPVCGESFCDSCGDCLGCGQCDGWNCPGGGRWVIYLDNRKNPYNKVSEP